MIRRILCCIALAALASCSGDDDDAKQASSVDSGTSPGTQATGGMHAAATGGTSAATGGLDAGHGTGGRTSHPTGSGGHDATDSGMSMMTDAGGDDSAPDYGMPMLHPDTSTDKVADCAGKPDMTLCDVVTAPDRWYDVCVDEQCVSPGCGDQTCNTPGPHFRIPPFKDHDALQFQSGDEPVTIDLITGLHWQSCSAGKSGADCKTGDYMMVKWSDALAYCDALSWAGHDDWYLPDPYELISIMEDDIPPDVDPQLSPTAFPNAIDAPLIHWSSTFMGPGQAMAISTDKTHGFDITTAQSTETQLAVRCVREASRPRPAPRTRATRTAPTRPTRCSPTTRPVSPGRRASSVSRTRPSAPTCSTR